MTPNHLAKLLRTPISSWQTFAQEALHAEDMEERRARRVTLHEAICQRTGQALVRREFDAQQEIAELLQLLIKQVADSSDGNDDKDLLQLSAFWQGLRFLLLRTRNIQTPERTMDWLLQSEDGIELFRWYLTKQRPVKRSELQDEFPTWTASRLDANLKAMQECGLLTPCFEDSEALYFDIGMSGHLMLKRHEKVFGLTKSTTEQPVKFVRVEVTDKPLNNFWNTPG